MSRWRPTEKNCIYVIPDIQGALGLLEKICARILPLRKSDGGKDMLVLLGDFIDRHKDSHKVLDFLIQLKKDYPGQVICIKGNHENIFLSMMNLEPQNLSLATMKHNHDMWLNNGGVDTLVGYLERAGIKEENPREFPRFRIVDLVPKEHIHFLKNELVDYYELDNYIFVHGGLDPKEDVAKQEPIMLYWDRSLIHYVKNAINNNKPEDIFWEKTIVTGHNGSTPVIHEKFLMLDCGSPKKLLVTELKSMKAFMAYPDKDRLVEYELEKTVKKAGSFKRVI